MTSFLEVLYAVHINVTEEDRIIWLPSTRRGFQVKSYYKVFKKAVNPSLGEACGKLMCHPFRLYIFLLDYSGQSQCCICLMDGQSVEL